MNRPAKPVSDAAVMMIMGLGSALGTSAASLQEQKTGQKSDARSGTALQQSAISG